VCVIDWDLPPMVNVPLWAWLSLEGRPLAWRYAAGVVERLGNPPPAYDAIADWYADYVTGAAAAFTARAGEALRRVLGRGHGVCWDIACGTGVYAEVINELGWTPIGTDLSIAQLRHAATRMPVAAADVTKISSLR
jgi:hypothetical protein